MFIVIAADKPCSMPGSLYHPFLELLAPAKTAAIGREAILHGADAVYIGGPSFGARYNAGNSVSEIADLVAFAHRFHARIYAALNTILHDTELEAARRLAYELYDAGVDALIVQDMGLLELDLPPLDLHASTQCDIRTPEKARFLADAGFSQIVLAREFTIEEIAAVRAALPPDTVIEHFIHGALCVAYSGQCYISHAQTGRSANRGDCSQACRLPYTLQDKQGRVAAFEKHLLSLKDNNQSANLRALIAAGVRSFKIEGRYKEAPYVKNITGHYRRLLDAILAEQPELKPASSGRTQLLFTPNPDKTFHRGATDYFSHGRQADIGAFDTPTFVGLPLGTITRIGPDWLELEAAESLANGDGLNYLHRREVIGVQANVVERIGKAGVLWRVWPNEPVSSLTGLRIGLPINRNRDHAWEQALTKKSAERRIGVSAVFAETGAARLPLPNPLPHAGEGAIESLRETDAIEGFSLMLQDEDGITATTTVAFGKQPAQHPAQAEAGLREQLSRFGNTDFELISGESLVGAGHARDPSKCRGHGPLLRNGREQLAITINWSQPWFVPSSLVNRLRRDAVAKLEAARLAAYVRPQRKPAVEPPAIYPQETLTYLANVYNSAARAFYTKHGVKLIAAAYEQHEETGEVSLMITRHCIRYSLSLCPKQAKGVVGVQGQVRAEPMVLVNGKERLNLKFDCKACEMHVMGKIRKRIQNAPPPSMAPVNPQVESRADSGRE